MADNGRFVTRELIFNASKMLLWHGEKHIGVRNFICIGKERVKG